MARFLLSAMPFTGHINPIRAVASALIARGHDVRVYSGEAFRTAVESAGARLVPWHHAPDFDESDLAATFPRLRGRKGLSQLLINVEDVFINTSAAQVQDLRDEWGREPWDAIAGDDVSMGAALYAEQNGGPWATISITPLNLAGTQGPPAGLGLWPGTNAFTKARDAALRGAAPLIARSLVKAIARSEEAIGLRPRGLTMEEVTFSRQLIVASGSSLLDFTRTDRPDFLHFVGELRMPPQASHTLPAWWSELEGRRVVHVTQGTQNIDPADLIVPTLEALADRADLLVVVATGVTGDDELPFPVPPEHAGRRISALRRAPSAGGCRRDERRMGRDARHARPRHPPRDRWGRPRQARDRLPRRMDRSGRQSQDGHANGGSGRSRTRPSRDRHVIPGCRIPRRRTTAVARRSCSSSRTARAARSTGEPVDPSAGRLTSLRQRRYWAPCRRFARFGSGHQAPSRG